MPDNHVATYLSDEQLSRWKEYADERDTSLSSWVGHMVEAGLKKFDYTVERDEDAMTLRRQRTELREQLRQARERIEELESQAYDGEQQAIVRFVENNPGVTHGEIVQHLIETTGERVNRQLGVLEGTDLVVDGDEYYPIGGR